MKRFNQLHGGTEWKLVTNSVIKKLHQKLLSHLLTRMGVSGKFLLTTVVAWSLAGLILFICSGDAYPTNDFFFQDQPHTLVRRNFVHKKFQASKINNNAIETILDGMMNDQGSGSGDEPDGKFGSGLEDGSGNKSVEEIGLSGLVAGSGDKPDEEIGLSGLVAGSGDKPDDEIGSEWVAGSGAKPDEEIESELVMSSGDKPEEESGSGFPPESGENEATQKFTKQTITSGSTDDLNKLSTAHHQVSKSTATEINESMASIQTTVLSSAFIPTTRPPPLELVSIEVCGRRYYCPKGSRGPCPANEILVEENGSNNSTEAPSYCSAYSNYPWGGCLSKVSEETESSSLSARCSFKSTDEPCSGYPPSYRYDPVTRSCRLAASSTGDWLVYECGEDQVYIGLNRKMGSCQCINEFHLIYTADNKCYQPFTRGPCDKNMWLMPSSRHEANCRPSPCPENQTDGKHFYWKGHFHGPAGCYEPGTRGPCPEKSTFIVTDYVLGHARCERNWNFPL